MRFLVAEIRDTQFVEREESVNALDLLGTPPAFVTYRQPVKSKVQARMTKDGEVVFSGKVSTVVTYQCGRCLEYFDKPLNLDFQQIVTADQLEIDISSEIRETLLIDLPVRAICRENCRGICSTCGKNLNTVACECAPAQENHSWDALKQIRFK